MVNVRRVGILSPGDMGAAIGNVLHHGGLEVYTCLEGRSELTRTRAAEAGFRDAPGYDELVSSVDVLLCVLVPAEARPVAERVAAALRRTGARPVYVECNAIAPQTVVGIEKLIRDAGAEFIDAGIIGGPPRVGGSNTRFHCSGPDTSGFEALAGHGLDVRVVGPKVGQASGLKMVYAASTKGTTALWTELIVAARAMGLDQQLMVELGDRGKQQLAGITGMPNRARRWVGEMEEIAATFEALGLTPLILEGAADMYRFVGDTPLADLTSRDPNPTLEEMLRVLTSHLHE